MFNKKRTCLLPVRVVSVISKYELNINLHVLLAQPQKILTLRAVTFQNGCNITGIVILFAGDLHHKTATLNQRRSTEAPKHQEERNSGSTLDLDEKSDEEDKLPSDLSIDHHPHRTCEYKLVYTESDEEKEDEEDKEDEENKEDEYVTESEKTVDVSKWVLHDVCISDMCLNFKEASLKYVKTADPAQISDIRLLAMNDIYIVDRNFTDSISKYFSNKVHTMLKPTLSFEAYLPDRGLNCYNWCMDLEVSPPADWITSMTLCADLLKEATGSKNILDIHTAQVLTQVLPVLINGPPDDTTEDSYVHYYLSPLFSSIFSTDPLLKMKWANGKLMDSPDGFKPDFLVYNISGNMKCVITIAEFKPTEKNSYVESDFVKLAKQMRDVLNKLIMQGVSKPRVCGIQCQGENINTYIMDLPSPKLYRLINASKIKLFKNMDQISLLPNIITHLLCLKNIALDTATKIETASLYSYSNLKRPRPDPPIEWLSNTKAVISRVPKKQKK